MLEQTGERLLPWDLQYPSNHYEHLQRYYFAAQFAARRKVLDLGSGEGYGADILAVVAKETTGVDISPEAVQWANQKYRRPNLRYLSGSATDIPIPGESIFDLVVCFELIEHVADQHGLLRDVRRLLKPEGLLIVSTPNRAVYSDAPNYQNPFHVRELYIPEFQQLVESFFPHASYMGQRVHPASAMWPLEGSTVGATEIIVERTKERFVPVGATRKSPMYVLALASQQPLAAEIQKTKSSYFFLVDISDTFVKRLCEDAQISSDARLRRAYDEWRQEANKNEAGLQAQIRSLSATLAGKESEIHSLSATLAGKKSEVRSLSIQVANQESENRQLRRDLAAREATITRISNELAERDNLLAGIQDSFAWKIQTRVQMARYGRLVKKSGLFQRTYYLSQNPDVAQAGIDPITHYFIRGANEGRDPHPLFDTGYYLSRNPDVAKASVNPLAHYLVRGAYEGRDPHPLFDTSYYLEQNPDVAKADENPLAHYLVRGAYEGRDPHPLFDTSYYLEQNPDVAKAEANALIHYLVYGAYEKRDPHPLFNSSCYLSQNPDVAEAGLNPLAHYLMYGAFAGRDPHPHFDSSYYLEQNPDVAEMRINPLVHYLGPGIAEGRDPNQSFDTTAYLEKNPEVALKGLNPLLHYLTNPPPFDLRAALRCEFENSGRTILDSEYDSSPLVSVIIPCFNQGHFLEDAVLSALLACSYPLEISVVDDGSTDPRSVTLVDKLAERYKFTLIRQANAGKSNARNAGIQRARGKFIQLLDADDLLAPGKIDIQVDELRANPDVDICISEYELCDAGGLNPRMADPSTIAGFSLSREDFLLRWGKGFFVPIHCALLRRELVQTIKFQSMIEVGEEDQTFWLELSSRSPKFKFHPAVLARRRIHVGNSPAYLKGPLGTAAKNTLHGPMVSVVIRCYNYGRYLDDAVRSILSQTNQDFEIIVIDDGSTDPETIRILDEYRQPKTRLIRTSNQGLSAALNNGIAASSGKYILPLDADDKIGSTYLEKAVRVLEENENIGIVYCKAEFFGEASGPWELAPFRFPDILLGNRIFMSAVFRRSDWEKVGGYDPRMIYGWEDYDFWLSLLELGREIHCMPESLFFYRKHGISTVAKMKREHSVHSFAQLFRNHPKLYVDNIAAILDDRPDLWSEFQTFIQGTGTMKDARLQLAWDVIEELILKRGTCNTLAETGRAIEV